MSRHFTGADGVIIFLQENVDIVVVSLGRNRLLKVKTLQRPGPNVINPFMAVIYKFIAIN
jgi:hypothetical protein